jgi:3-hydroxyisobutyrate dehydrogenase
MIAPFSPKFTGDFFHMTHTERLGFIGLGIMGQGMTRNLLKAGFPVTVWNRTRAKMEALLAEGATPADSPADLAAQCDLIITCVSDTPDVQAVLLGENGVIHGARAGALVIDMSTISPRATRDLAGQLAQKNIAFLDAPISGGSEGAARGTLSIMVGGAEADFQRALPAFQAMGQTITHMGAVGAGQTTKLVNQILVVGNMLAAAEALIFAQAGGLDLQKTLTALASGAAGSWMWTNRGAQAIVRDWRPGFTIDLQQKDLRLVLAEAGELGLPLLATSLIHNLYLSLQAEGLGAEGNHALVKALEKLAGLQVGGATAPSNESA